MNVKSKRYNSQVSKCLHFTIWVFRIPTLFLLLQVVQQKLDELREAGIDEKYISEVVRKLHQPKRLTD